MFILSYLIFIGLIILAFILGYKKLGKLIFDLDGYEIVFYQLCFILLLHVGSYYIVYDEIFEVTAVLSFWGFGMLALYYLVRMIITKKYISLKNILLYILAFVVDIISMCFLVRGDWDGLYYFIAFFVSLFALIYILLINLITWIIRISVKESVCEEQNTLKLNKNMKLLFICMSIFCSLTYGFWGMNLYNYLEKSYQDSAREFVLNYLNERYDEHDFKIISIENYEDCSMFSCSDLPFVYDVTLSSKYNSDFIVTVDMLDEEINEDPYVFAYFSYLSGKDIDSYYDIERYFEDYISNDISINKLAHFDAEVIFEDVDLDEEKFESMNFSNVDDVEDFYFCLEIREPKIMVNKVFTSEELDVFNLYIIDIYKTLDGLYIKDSGNNMVDFDFNYKNPFSNSWNYRNGGYIKEVNNMYLIYSDAKPSMIDK